MEPAIELDLHGAERSGGEVEQDSAALDERADRADFRVLEPAKPWRRDHQRLDVLRNLRQRILLARDVEAARLEVQVERSKAGRPGIVRRGRKRRGGGSLA